VASVKFLISQKPKIAMIFYPGSIGLISPLPFMFSAIILDPASPNPKAKRAPIFTMVYSRTTVSIRGPFLERLFFFPLFFFISSSFALSRARASFSSS